MLRMLYTVGSKVTDISKYVDWKTVTLQEQINIPAQLNFDGYNFDAGFPVLVQRAYVQLFSTKFNRSLFTGYVSSQPNAVFVALQPGGSQLFQYKFICTSDEHLLNIKAVPFIPAFVDQTQGSILTQLAEILCPGLFDTSAVGSGDIEPYFTYDPNSSWCEVAKKFADGSRYRYKVRDKRIWFQPYGDGPLGISYDETQAQRTFDPSSQGLQTSVLAVPTVNDVTVIGAAEAGNSREDYFIGDGFTGNFPLRHKVFNGSSTLLLTDDWTESDFNTQQWLVGDPGAQFNLGAGALNIVSTFGLPLGQSFIQLNNGLELAGGIDLEHGEFGFNDYSAGIIGGLYTQSLESNVTYSSGNCLGGFFISSPTGVITSASGAAGVVIQPTWGGVAIGAPVLSAINHTYVLQTVVTAPKYVRYNRWYRSLAGNAYGGAESSVTGNVTFIIQDFNLAAATGFYYQPVIHKTSVSAVNLPAFCVYALVNNQQLNVTVNYTTLATMPLGSLSAYEGPSGLWFPSGLILPMLPPGRGGYVGSVAPWPSDASGNIFAPPLTRSTSPHQEVLGNGFEMQAAQITQGNEADTLAFYAQTLPAAGTPVRLQSWESQAAISRLQASGSIATEASVVGDDGIRSAIVSNMSPLPRTSEDCDAAAQAFLDDRTGIFYNGTYNCTSYFLNQLSSDGQFWPTCGRYLYVNSPARGIFGQYMLVTQLTITVLDAVGSSQPTLAGQGQVGEVLRFSIGFGADLHLEKVLYNFVDIQPTSVLTPKDTAEPVQPRFNYQVANFYLPDLSSIMVSPITDTTAQVSIYDQLAAPIEIRLQDANWGQGATPDYVGTVHGSTFSLNRTQFENIWYMRFVNTTTGQFSRRSKVVRIVYPVKPSPPTLISADSHYIQLDFNGDIRSIYGVELRRPTPTPQTYLPALSASGTWTNSANAVSASGYASTRSNLIATLYVNVPPFSLPAGAVLMGMALVGTGYTQHYTESLSVQAAGSIRTCQLGTVLNTFMVGSSSDLWGMTPAAIEGGFSFSLTTGSVPPQNVFVNNVQVLIYYQVGLVAYGILIQKPATSYGDLNLDLTKTENTAAITTDPLAGNRTFFAYFFNHQWSYSDPVQVVIPAPNPLALEPGYRFGQSLNMLCTLPQRNDFTGQIWQVSNTGAFGFSDIILNQTANSAGPITLNVPAQGDLWVRTMLVDYIGSGSWFPTVSGTHIPSGDLIASDYLVGQGSVPPVVATNLGFGAGVLAYNSAAGASGAVLNLYAQSFNVWFPNGEIVSVPATSASYVHPLDATGNLHYATDYGFFPALKNPTSWNPFLDFGGPFAYYTSGMLSTSALTGAYRDGSVPLTNGALVALTATSGAPAATGQVVYVNIDNPGINYAPYGTYNLNFSGDGFGAIGYAYTDVNGAVTSTSVAEGGTGYTHATATISGVGTGAAFSVVIGNFGAGGGG